MSQEVCFFFYLNQKVVFYINFTRLRDQNLLVALEQFKRKKKNHIPKEEPESSEEKNEEPEFDEEKNKHRDTPEIPLPQKKKSFTEEEFNRRLEKEKKVLRKEYDKKLEKQEKTLRKIHDENTKSLRKRLAEKLGKVAELECEVEKLKEKISEWEKPRENVAIWDRCFSASNMMSQNATRPKHMCQNPRQRGSYFCSDHINEFEKKKNTTTFYQYAHLLVQTFRRENYPFPQFHVDVLTTDLPGL